MKQKLLGLVSLFLLISGCTPLTNSSSELPSSSSESSSSEMSSSISSSEVVMKESRLHVYSVPQGVTQYTDAELFIGEQKIDLYNVKTNNAQSWEGYATNRVDTAAAIIRLEGKATLTVKCHYTLSSTFTKVRPLAYGITPTFDLPNNSFSFEINSTGKYVIEPNGERIKAIHLFVNSMEDYDVSKTASNVIYFGPGLHTSNNDARLANGSIVNVNSNQIVYLDYGAVVRARFTSYNATNVQIIGGGIIDGSTFDRIAGQATGNTAFIPIDFDYCTNITFKDFTILDPAGWTVNCYFDNGGVIDNINMITSRSNGDGVTLQSCQNFEVSNVFVRSWDDSLVVKNYPRWSDRTQHGTTRNIHFYNCTLWTDLAQSMEIGYETVGEVLEGVTFENITVLHNYHKPVISIHNANDANVRDILYKDITVEDASMGGGDAGDNKQLIQFRIAWSSNWSDAHAVTGLGTIDDVLVTNVKVMNGNNNIPIDMAGVVDTRSAYYGTTHFVSNITLNNISMKGSVIGNDYLYLTKNAYTNSIEVTSDGNPVTGARLLRTWSLEELQTYSSLVTVFID